jgi:hypothetical protein
MYRLLVRLMLLSALAQFGMSWKEFRDCRGRACLRVIEKLSREVLRIEWKPISVFPKETMRFGINKL